MPKMTPEQEAAYALTWELPREDLRPAVQVAYDKLIAERSASGQPVVTSAPPRPRARPDGYAAASLVLGLVMPGIGSILAIIFGVKSSRQAREDGLEPSGLATAGIIIGVIGLVLAVIEILLFISFVSSLPS